MNQLLRSIGLLALGACLLPPSSVQGRGPKLDEKAGLRVGSGREGSPSKEVKLHYRLLIAGEFLPRGGLKVLSVNPAGPGANLIDVRRRNRGILDRGDVITRVNGTTLKSPLDYYKALNESGERKGIALITVRDVNTNRESDWRARPARVVVIGKPPTAPEDRASAVKVLIVGDTDDPSIGKMITVSIEKVRERLENAPRLATDNIRLLTGKDVTAKNIVAEIDRLRVKRDEALLYYHLGHGAYDESYAGDDRESNGHYFAIGNNRGNLLRKTVRNRLLAKKARLTVLLSDTCNIKAPALPPPEYAEKSRVLDGQNWLLGNLLLDHTGVIDVSGSSKDEYGWFSTDIGGWFSSSFVETTNPKVFAGRKFVTWDLFVKETANQTSTIFKERKGRILESPDLVSPTVLTQIRDQKDQRPQVFVNRVKASR